MAGKTDERASDEKVVEIEMERLRAFENHPFKVIADSQMIELQEDILISFLFCEVDHVVRCAIEIFTDTFQRNQCDVHVFLQTVKSVIIEDLILQHHILCYFALAHCVPQRAVINHDKNPPMDNHR